MFGQKIRLVTHNGNFHADDVFACATLSLMLESQGQKFTITRTRDEQIIRDGDYVFDIGREYDPERNRFDHHQPSGAGTHDNGVPYASAGLVWNKFGETICDSVEVAEVINTMIVQPIDALDNGVDISQSLIDDLMPFSFQTIINIFRPQWQESRISDDDQFFKMVELMKVILSRAIISTTYKLESQEIIEATYDKSTDKELIIFDQPLPRDQILRVLGSKPEPLFYIYQKSSNGRWKLEGVRKNPNSFELRKELPESWAGKKGDDLVNATGVPDADFCHNGRWLAVARTLDGAKALAKLARAV